MLLQIRDADLGSYGSQAYSVWESSCLCVRVQKNGKSGADYSENGVVMTMVECILVWAWLGCCSENNHTDRTPWAW